jgi:hypothetical protein
MRGIGQPQPVVSPSLILLPFQLHLYLLLMTDRRDRTRGAGCVVLPTILPGFVKNTFTSHILLVRKKATDNKVLGKIKVSFVPVHE